MTNKNTKTSKEEEGAKREILKNPGRDDVHEQREDSQRNEGIVTAPETKKPSRSPKARRR